MNFTVGDKFSIAVDILPIYLPGEIGQPWGHVLQAQMLHLNVGVAESLYAFLEELQREMRLVARQPLADRLDEDGVVGRDTQA